MGHEICMNSRLRNGHKPCYVLFTDTKDLGKGIMQQPGCRPRPRTLPKQRNEVLHLGIIMRAHVQHVERDGELGRTSSPSFGRAGRRAGQPHWSTTYKNVRSFRSGEQEGHSTEVTATGSKSQSSVDVVRPRLPSLDRSIHRSIPHGYVAFACSMDRGPIPKEKNCIENCFENCIEMLF